MQRGIFGRITGVGALVGLLALAACDRDDDDTTVADDESGERDADDDPEALICADLNCGEGHTCVVPGLYCDRSGPAPVLTRDAPYCAVPSAGPTLHADDRSRELQAQGLCPSPDVIVSDDGRDGTIVRCPALDIDPVCE